MDTTNEPKQEEDSLATLFHDNKTLLTYPPPPTIGNRSSSSTLNTQTDTTLTSNRLKLSDLVESKDLEAGDYNHVVLPEKPGSWIRYVALSCYRRLFSIAVLANVATFVYVMVRDDKLVNIINATAANLLALGLARQPLVVNALFRIFGSIPRTAPFLLRRLCAKIYCYGGVHSGCGVAALMWYTGLIGLFTQQYALQNSSSRSQILTAELTIAYIILALLLAIIVMAYPRIRTKVHNYFELTHRFSGWAVVILFWPLLILFSLDMARTSGQSLGHFLIRFPAFWFIIITTFAILHPWILLRRIPIRAEPVSSHAIRLHMSHTRIDFGQGISLAKHPLRDWHSFATFPDSPSAPGTTGTTEQNPTFSCLISKAGDWTGDVIARPPTHLYKRAVPIYGFGYVMKVFKSMVLVTTGSGIGPCLSFIGDPERPAMRILWQTRTPEKTYGQPIIDLVKQLDPNPEILDTSISGKRTNMLPMVLTLVQEINAEAVCVISNPETTAKLVFECEARGIHAFGPIFDS